MQLKRRQLKSIYCPAESHARIASSRNCNYYLFEHPAVRLDVRGLGAGRLAAIVGGHFGLVAGTDARRTDRPQVAGRVIREQRFGPAVGRCHCFTYFFYGALLHLKTKREILFICFFNYYTWFCIKYFKLRVKQHSFAIM